MSVLKYFKNTPGRPPIGRQALSVFFLFKFAMRSLEKKGPVAPPPRATGACRPLGGRQAPPFFSRDLVANLKKKITLRACRPLGGRPGGIFEIFQNGHIFLKF